MTEPFDFDHFVALPRLSGLRLAPDGSRLVVAVATPGPDGKDLRTALWQVDPSGDAAPRRLTRSAVGESNAAFLPDGSLLFTSARPDPDAKKDDKPDEEPPAALWHLPAGGGEARLLLAPPGGIAGLVVARDAGTVALLAPLHPDAADFDADRERHKARKDAGVSALLYESYPIRYWDHYLGPRDGRYFVADPPADDEAPLGKAEDLTGPSGAALPEPTFAISPDGRSLATTWRRYRTGSTGDDIVIIDRATRERRSLTGGVGWSGDPAFSPDGRRLAVARGVDPAPDVPERVELVVFDVESGDARVVARDLDRWPMVPVWTPDGDSILFTADEGGGVSIYRVEVAGDGRDGGDTVTRLARGAAFSDVAVSPDGATVYALRAHPDRPPHVVRLDARAHDQEPVELRSPATPAGDLPGSTVIERLTARADDGVEIGSWLLRPAGASADDPAPLVVFVHGGPLGTWAGWSWRWNANLLAERGYAVLMPDPALSIGYGQAMIDRGWGRWGERPYTDVMSAVDGALQRPDIDGTRTALMGGSFGGYMANWVAGHTDRFKAIVTHASLWELRGFHGTTDDGVSWEQEMGNPYEDGSRFAEHSPHTAVGDIKTPMLVIHGELDARVPISEALRLWTDLHRHGVEAKFLYYPDENHWVLKPQNSRVWYETVLAFLDRYVLGAEWKRPALL
jgi:dipeptidyl aminopeptidase/acylaminoacyl peptidase